MPTDPIFSAVSLAKMAIVWERAHEVYFPASAHEMAEVGAKILAAYGIEYWLSADGTSITCAKCRRTSHSPHDVEQRYCGACHEFLKNREAA